MRIPETLDVIDNHGGFTAITLSPTYVKIIVDGHGEREAVRADYQPELIHKFVRWDKVMREHSTLWRPAQLLKRGTIGKLDETDEHSFYQNNDDVTKAFYKVPGYRFRVVVWFDNKTGERIA